MDKPSSNSENRSRARFEHISPVCIKNWGDAALHRARMRNYSSDGLYFESDACFAEGSLVHIAIKSSPFRNAAADYDCYAAMIVWRDPLVESPFTYGYGITLFAADGAKIIGATELFQQPERRRHRRKKVRAHVNIGVREKLLVAHSKDFSPSGACIQSSAELNVGETLKLSVPAGNGSEINLEGKVVWSSPEGYGLRFSRIAAPVSNLSGP
jgi:hypothetical protein